MQNARKFTRDLLTAFFENSSYSNILLDNALVKSELSAQDKKFAANLFYGVIERKITLDAVINKYSKIPAEKLSSDVLQTLRLAVYQILFMDSVPDRAAVFESVKLAKSGKNPAIGGYVNGVLRAFLRDGKKIPELDDKISNLSVKYSCPEWLIEKWINEHGEDMALEMLKSSVGAPPVTARLNILKKSADEIINDIIESGVEIKLRSEVENCAQLFNVRDISRLGVYKKGMFHIQDISSQICCEILDPKPDETVLDVCSAPGGKAFTIAEIMNNQGKVIACDLYEQRVKLITDGSKRLGIDIIEAKVNDATAFSDKIEMADRVLCDVPCSGLGVIRRKPEIKYKNPKDFDSLKDIQRKILDVSSKYLKKGGFLVYSTCTLSRAENDDIIDWFLESHTDFEKGSINGFSNIKGGNYKVTITPNMFNSDGFFVAKLIKKR